MFSQRWKTISGCGGKKRKKNQVITPRNELISTGKMSQYETGNENKKAPGTFPIKVEFPQPCCDIPSLNGRKEVVKIILSMITRGHLLRPQTENHNMETVIHYLCD